MAEPAAIDELGRLVAESGLVAPHSDGVVMVSGGPDSACAAAGLRQHLGSQAVNALHVNYGLRPDSDRDEECARELCANLRIDLHVERPRLAPGNLQAAARQARYELAEELRSRRSADWIATGHSRSDLAETFIYRLASSPGSRALLGMPERSGRIVRPLLRVSRDEIRRLAVEAKLPFVDDPSNADRRYARNRIRADVLPTLRAISGEAERNIAITRAEIEEEAAALDQVVGELLAAATVEPDGAAASIAELARSGPALRRLALRELAVRASRSPVPLGRRRADSIWRLAETPTGGSLDLGGALRVIVEAGVIRFSTDSDIPAPASCRMVIPGRVRFGSWLIEAESVKGPIRPAGPAQATLDAERLGGVLDIRSWRHGDRMRPLGLGGSRSLQDLFSDRKLPRSQRNQIPVVLSGEEIVWVPGIAIADDLRIDRTTRRVVILHASPHRSAKKA